MNKAVNVTESGPSAKAGEFCQLSGDCYRSSSRSLEAAEIDHTGNRCRLRSRAPLDTMSLALCFERR
jgi:hypothetical protein